MINLVRLALRRPYSAAVGALLITLMGVLSVMRMPIDIFPIIDIPVVEVAWSYGGLSAEDMERRIIFVAERNYSTSVNGIERIESESIPGAGLVKIYFQQGADIGAGIAQITAAHKIAINAALMASRSTTDMRNMDGETDAGGWPRPGWWCAWGSSVGMAGFGGKVPGGFELKSFQADPNFALSY